MSCKYGGNSLTKEPYRPGPNNPQTTLAKFPTVYDIKDRILQLKQTFNYMERNKDLYSSISEVLASINEEIEALEKEMKEAYKNAKLNA